MHEDPFSEFPDLKFLVQVMDAITDGCRPTVPSKCPLAFSSLIRDCWQQESRRRPTFDKIVERLLRIQSEMESYVIICSPDSNIQDAPSASSPCINDQRTGDNDEEGSAECPPAENDLSADDSDSPL